MCYHSSKYFQAVSVKKKSDPGVNKINLYHLVFLPFLYKDLFKFSYQQTLNNKNIIFD